MADRPVKIIFAPDAQQRYAWDWSIAAPTSAATRSRSAATSGPDDVRLSDIEPQFVCTACGKRGADVRPDFNWNVRGPIGGMGYR